MKVSWYEHEITVKLPSLVQVCSVGRWKIMLRPLAWSRARGDWPTHWRENYPNWEGPVFRYWHFGPIDVWRFREHA